jgi:hypothetical protein
MAMKKLNLAWDAFLSVMARQSNLRGYYIAHPQGTDPETYEYDAYLTNPVYLYRTRVLGEHVALFEQACKARCLPVTGEDEIEAMDLPPYATNGAMMIERQTKTGKAGFNQYTLCSYNFCKKTTWYQHFDQHTDDVCTPNEDFTIYSSSTQAWINIEDYTLAIQDYARGGSPWGQVGVFQRDGSLAPREDYWPVVKVNDVIRASGYTIDYPNGRITFAEALQSTDVVKVSFRSVKATSGSDFVLRPPAGHKYVIPHVELNLGVDVKLSSPVYFEVWAGDPSFGMDPDYAPYFLQYIMKYKSWQQLVGIGVVGKDEYTALGGSDAVTACEDTGWCPNQKSGLQHGVVTIPYNFGLDWGKAIELDSTFDVQLRIRIPGDQPLAGEYATCGLYIEDTLL